MKEQNGNEKKKKMTNEKKFYLFSAIGCATALLAIIVVALVIANTGNVDHTAGKNSSSAPQHSSVPDNTIDENEGNHDSTGNKPVVNTPEGMMMPIEQVSVSNDYGFYYNQTLNNYYEHQGMDFAATVGVEVYAVQAGVVESIYRDDVLTGTEITIDHGNGLKTVYRFVDAVEELAVGVRVERGDVIATVAEPAGDEYKEGAHLHFEVLKENESVDPATYLTFEEK